MRAPRFQWACAILIVLWCSLSYANAKELTAPLSSPDGGGIVLRVKVLDHDRFAPIDTGFAKTVTNRAQLIVMRHFGVVVKFDHADAERLNDRVRQLNKGSFDELDGVTLDLSHAEDIEWLREQLTREFESNAVLRRDAIRYLNSYRQRTHVPMIEAAASGAEVAMELVKIHVSYWKKIVDLKSTSGLNHISNDQLNSSYMWSLLAKHGTDAEVVLTNQVIASAETFGAEIHSSLRGGLANGLTVSAKGSRTGALSVVSTAGISVAAQLNASRRGKPFTNQQTIDIAAHVLAHELGHQLFHYGHPFSVQACLMNPPFQFFLLEWIERLDAGKCREANDPAMKKGAFTGLKPVQ